jgi:hypothetical protein
VKQLNTLISILLIIFFCSSLRAADLTLDQQRQDFQVFRDSLKEGHGNLYRFVSDKNLDFLFSSAEQKLTSSQSLFSFYKTLAAIVVEIKCGHTRIKLPDQTLKDDLFLPFKLRFLNRELYIVHDFPTEKNSVAGSKILSINGISSAEILNALKKHISGDGDIESGRMSTINENWFINRYVKVLCSLSSPFHLVIQGAPPIKVSGIALSKFSEDSHELDSAALSFVQNTAILKMFRFYGTADGQDLTEFYKKAFQQIRERKSTSLILDLRNNPGGFDHFGVTLVSYFLDQPYKHYADIRQRALRFSFEKYLSGPLEYPQGFFTRGTDEQYHATGHPNWALEKNREPGFRGKLFVLMNGGTFSTASEVAAQLHFHKRATFIGEETGGGYYGNTAGFMPIVILPNSKIQLELPLTAYELAVNSSVTRSRGVPADHTVSYTIHDLINRKDKELDFALRLCGENF